MTEQNSTPIVWFRIAGIGVLIFVWTLLIPLIFIVLYTALDVQSAARAAANADGIDPKLATFEVTKIAEDIRNYNADAKRRSGDAPNEFRAKLQDHVNKGTRDTSIAREKLLNALVVLASEVKLELPTECSDAETTDFCFRKVSGAALGIAGFTIDGSSPKLITDHFSDARKFMDDYQTASVDLKEAKETFALNVSVLSYERQKIEELVDSGTKKLNTVALTYNGLFKSLPLFKQTFPLPSGVVVAFFTAVMGAIGAGVYTLLGHTNQRDQRPQWYGYGARPLLGAMAGFMVFFVVSAGAAFLIQPQSGSSVGDAINSLSPPALASLGVFAGLAAEDALNWLKSKAAQFFEVTPKPPRE